EDGIRDYKVTGVQTCALPILTFSKRSRIIFREREMILDLFEKVTGGRLHHVYYRLGGVYADLPEGWVEECGAFLDYFLTRVDERSEERRVGKEWRTGGV